MTLKSAADPEAKIGVKFALADMTNFQLAAFAEILEKNPESPRSACEDQTWWSHVEQLFTEDGGQRMLEEIRLAVIAVALESIDSTISSQEADRAVVKEAARFAETVKKAGL